MTRRYIRQLNILPPQEGSRRVTVTIAGPPCSGKRMIERFLNYERKWLKSDYGIDLKIKKVET